MSTTHIYISSVLLVIFFNIYYFLIVKKINKKVCVEVVIKALTVKLQTLKNKEGLVQLNEIGKKNIAINNVLENNFNTNDISYIQYKDVVNDVYSNFIDNLEKYYLIMRSIKLIDLKGLEKKIKEQGWHNNKEKDIFQNRFELSNKCVIDANLLLFENEKALLKLDVLSAEIIAININSSHEVNIAKENLFNLSKKLSYEK